MPTDETQPDEARDATLERHGLGSPPQEVIDAPPPAARPLARRADQPLAEAPVEITPLTVQQLMDRANLIITASKEVMVKDVDYGIIPGCDKPTLFKPGGEKLCVLFQMASTFKVETIEYEGGHREHRVTCKMSHIPAGLYVGSGVGSCTTLEAKYRYRKSERKCPTCGKAAIIKGKAEYDGGWVCWKKRNGCGAKFKDGDQAIEGQPADRVENPDIADTYNTVLKMACKRALVAAVLICTGASAVYTQDVEDMPEFGADDDAKPTPPAAEAEKTATTITKIVETKYRAGDAGVNIFGVHLEQPDVWLRTIDNPLADEAKRYADLGEHVQVTATKLADRGELIAIVPAPRGDDAPEEKPKPGEQELEAALVPAMSLDEPVGKSGESDPTVDTPVRVTRRTGQTGSKKWTLFTVYGISGEKYNTFDSTVAHFCFTAGQAERSCLLYTEESKRDNMPDTLIGVGPDVRDDTGEPEGDPQAGDDIPF